MKSISSNLNFQVWGWIEAIVFHIRFSSLHVGLTWASEALEPKSLYCLPQRYCLVSHRANVYKWYLTLLLYQSLFFWLGIFWAACSLYIFNNSWWIFLPWIYLIFPPIKLLLCYKLCSVLVPLSWFFTEGSVDSNVMVTW